MESELWLIACFNGRYYVGRKDEVDAAIDALCAELPNVHNLHRHAVRYGGVRIVGATLWSHVPHEHQVAVARSLTDYGQITVPTATGFRKVTVTDTNEWHRQDVEFIRQHIEDAKTAGEKVVVLTHHAPLGTGVSAPQYDGMRKCSDLQCRVPFCDTDIRV